MWNLNLWNNNKKVSLFASLLYLKIGISHKLRCMSQSHNQDKRNKKCILFFYMSLKNTINFNDPALMLSRDMLLYQQQWQRREAG